MSGGWALERLEGTVARLHERSVQAVRGYAGGRRLARSVLVMEASDRALVLGSSQRSGVADARACAREGVAVVRRGSGGGAVLVEPGGQLWVDLLVPAGDPLWEADVGKAAWWVGEAWADALALAGLQGADVWKGPFTRRPGSDWSCFATLAGGEVTLPQQERPSQLSAGTGGTNAGDTLLELRAGTASAPKAPLAEPQAAVLPKGTALAPKVVGISQKRTRSGALFQCSCLLRWEPCSLVELLCLAPGERALAARDLAKVASPVPVGGHALLEALLASLPGGTLKTSRGT